MLAFPFRVLQGRVHFFAAAFLAAAFLAAAGFAGLDLPKEPLKIFPFFVFLSPRPMFGEF